MNQQTRNIIVTALSDISWCIGYCFDPDYQRVRDKLRNAQRLLTELVAAEKQNRGTHPMTNTTNAIEAIKPEMDEFESELREWQGNYAGSPIEDGGAFLARVIDLYRETSSRKQQSQVQG